MSPEMFIIFITCIRNMSRKWLIRAKYFISRHGEQSIRQQQSFSQMDQERSWAYSNRTYHAYMEMVTCYRSCTKCNWFLVLEERISWKAKRMTHKNKVMIKWWTVISCYCLANFPGCSVIIGSVSFTISLWAASRYFLCVFLTLDLKVSFCTSGRRKLCTRSETISSDSNSVLLQN